MNNLVIIHCLSVSCKKMSTVSLTSYLRTENEQAYDGRLLREKSSIFIPQDFALSKYVFFVLFFVFKQH